jgi:hypothetical protein
MPRPELVAILGIAGPGRRASSPTVAPACAALSIPFDQTGKVALLPELVAMPGIARSGHCL